MDRRPAPWIRVLVLCVAIGSLALTMCHSEKRAQAPSASPQSQAAQPPDSAPAPPPRPEYFPATKAPGRF